MSAPPANAADRPRPGDARGPGPVRTGTEPRDRAWGACFGWIFGGTLAAGLVIALLWPQVQGARHAAHQSHDRNNLKQIGLAGRNFRSTYQTFPPHVDAGGTNWARATGPYRDLGPDNPRMAWMTAMLPYLDCSPLWSRVDPSLAFDDPAAADVYGTRVSSYLSPAHDPPPGGPAPAHYAGNVRLLGEGRDSSPTGLTDGAANTIFAGNVHPTAGAPAPWGDPDNLRDPADGVNVPGGFGSPWPGGAQFVMADGSVRFLADTADPAVLAALATPDGGEVMDDF